jgi:ornithine cyclodeaminase/alanine dehydrogenase-like protein (mu-crystallin family)
MEYLNEEQVRERLTWEGLIPAMERALRDLSLGKIQQPVRSVLRVPEYQGILGLMPAVDGDVMGAKFVTIYEKNAQEAQLPTHQATFLLFSARTGEPLAAMDGRLITEMRTAAVSAVAAKLFAPPEARVLAILGSGVQASSHARALRRVRNFEEVRVWSRTAEHARAFAAEQDAKAMESAEEASRGADVVVSACSVREPLVRGDWLGDRTLVCAVGAVGPERREVDDAAMCGAVVVESREAAMRESGDVIGSGEPICAEIGEILAGLRPVPERRVVYKSLGVAAEDLAAAALVWRARSQND